MKKKFLFLASALLMFFSSFPIDGAKTDIIAPSNLNSCLDYQGYDRSGGITLRFRNRCDISLYAMACVTYYNNTQESKKSTSRIPKNGRWNITFFDGSSPKSVDWTAAVTPTEIPDSCS